MKNSINAFDVEDFLAISMSLTYMIEENKNKIKEIKSKKCISKKELEDLETHKFLDEKLRITLKKVENIFEPASK
ncbi:hypothetical protein I9Y31_002866 [Clostridium perfringens]|nr:hypothetical protein [Clostridium perfringens]